MIKNIFAGKWEFHVPAWVSAPNPMTQVEFEGKWNQIRGRQVRTWWDKLSEGDLDQVAGKFELFMDLLQAKYGYSRERAEKEFTQRLAEYESREINARVAEYGVRQNSKHDVG